MLVVSWVETAYVTETNDNSSMQLHAPWFCPQAAYELTETDVVRWRHGRASDRKDNSQ